MQMTLDRCSKVHNTRFESLHYQGSFASTNSSRGTMLARLEHLANQLELDRRIQSLIPSVDEAIRMACEHPPAQEWFEGDEEKPW